MLQVTLLQENDIDELPDVQTSYYDWINLLRDKSTLIITGAICICTSSMAILEPCVPIWLLGHLNPPPSKWQLGAVFIPDSIGYFIGSHFAGNNEQVKQKNKYNLFYCSIITCGTMENHNKCDGFNRLELLRFATCQ